MTDVKGTNGRTFKKEDTDYTTLVKGVEKGEVYNLNAVTDLFMQLSKEQRKKLASRLKDANSFAITKKDLKNLNFISNTTPDELLEAFPELQEEYTGVTFPLD